MSKLVIRLSSLFQNVDFVDWFLILISNPFPKMARTLSVHVWHFQYTVSSVWHFQHIVSAAWHFQHTMSAVWYFECIMCWPLHGIFPACVYCPVINIWFFICMYFMVILILFSFILLQHMLDEATDPWGVKVERVEV